MTQEQIIYNTILAEIESRIDAINDECEMLESKYPSSEYHNNVGVSSEKCYFNGQRQAFHYLKNYIKSIRK